MSDKFIGIQKNSLFWYMLALTPLYFVGIDLFTTWQPGQDYFLSQSENFPIGILVSVLLPLIAFIFVYAAALDKIPEEPQGKENRIRGLKAIPFLVLVMVIFYTAASYTAAVTYNLHLSRNDRLMVIGASVSVALALVLWLEFKTLAQQMRKIETPPLEVWLLFFLGILATCLSREPLKILLGIISAFVAFPYFLRRLRPSTQISPLSLIFGTVNTVNSSFKALGVVIHWLGILGIGVAGFYGLPYFWGLLTDRHDDDLTIAGMLYGFMLLISFMALMTPFTAVWREISHLAKKPKIEAPNLGTAKLGSAEKMRASGTLVE